MTTLLWILIGLNAAMLVAGWQLYRRTKNRPVERRVEGPNSEYKSRYVLDLEARERWRALDLDLLHPLNRDEVVGLLGRLDGGSSRVLTQQERDFLDRMVEAERRALKSARRSSIGSSPRPHGA